MVTLLNINIYVHAFIWNMLYGKKNVPNHQPVYVYNIYILHIPRII